MGAFFSFLRPGSRNEKVENLNLIIRRGQRDRDWESRDRDFLSMVCCYCCLS